MASPGALAEQGWLALDACDCLSRPLLEALREEIRILDRTDAMQAAGVGRGADRIRDRSIRRDRISWLQGITPPQTELFGFLEALRTGLNRQLFLGLKRFESHYATYHAGDFYKRHLDSFRGRASPGGQSGAVFQRRLAPRGRWRPAGIQPGRRHPGMRRSIAGVRYFGVVPERGNSARGVAGRPHPLQPSLLVPAGRGAAATVPVIGLRWPAVSHFHFREL